MLWSWLLKCVLKGHGFSRAAKQAIDLRASAPEGMFFGCIEGVSPAGIRANHSNETLLIVVNKAQPSKTLDLQVEETALSACTQFGLLILAEADK
jgi:hypothetical protein